MIEKTNTSFDYVSTSLKGNTRCIRCHVDHRRATACDYFLCADPRITLDMSAYMGAEGGTSVIVCAELSNVLPVSGTTADISTSFMLTDGDAGKR